MIDPTFAQRLKAIDWTSYGTAYGPALNTPGQLIRLAGTDVCDALKASHEIWCGLCHQHAYVSSAALPALPFILEVLDHAGEQLTIEILDILLGFAVCTRPGFSNSPPAWLDELRQGVKAQRGRLEKLAVHTNPEISGFARDILDELAFPPQ